MLSNAFRTTDSPYRALRAPEAAQWLTDRLNVSPPVTAQILWRLTRTERIPTLIIGGQYFYRTDQLEAWIQGGGGTPVRKPSRRRASDEQRNA